MVGRQGPAVRETTGSLAKFRCSLNSREEIAQLSRTHGADVMVRAPAVSVISE
jgi:hypothetical protein